MLDLIKKYKRGFVLLAMVCFFLICSLILLDNNFELSGSMFMFIAAGSIIYDLLFRFWRKGSAPNIVKLRQQNEVWRIAITTGFLCLIAAIETYTSIPEMALVFMLLFILTLIFVYSKIRTQQLKSPYWLFFINTGIILIMFNDQEGEDFYEVLILCYFLLLFLTIASWIFNQIRGIIKLKNEHTKAELSHLQSQVNPHFFFNMLNNLYGWVEKDPKKAQALILKLSDMMRYSIYDGQKQYVTIEEEIDYLTNYIALHKSRYHKKIEVTFKTEVASKDTKVMPLLFIILLENAFKHGVENLREDAFVNIHFTSSTETINFEIENNFEVDEKNKSSGIGLKNLKRRLELGYPDKHQLSLLSDDNIFKAQLNIQPL